MKKILFITSLIFTFLGFSQDLPMQDGPFVRCEPDKFFDSGGEINNYGDNENFTTTICAPNADEFIILDFTVFNTQLNADILTIYDGDDTTAPPLGTFSGGVSPGLVQASDANTSGCLTIEFTSNASSNGEGWVANIACARPCQTITASIDTTTPEPNPSGVVVILPGTEVTFNGSANFSVPDTVATYFFNEISEYNLVNIGVFLIIQALSMLP